MPIVKLSDEKTLSRAFRFPHCLELAKGGPKPKRGSGKELPYWRVIERMPGAKAAFEAAYGTEVKELPDAALAYDTPEQCFDSWVECREPGVGGKFWWRSDGERSVIRWDAEANEYTDDPDRQLLHKDLPNRKWERNQGRLFVRLQALARNGFSQPVLIRTGGINDIVRIAQFLHGLKEEIERVYGPDQTLKHYLVMLWRFEVSRADPTSGGRYPHWDIGIARSPLYMQSALKDAQQTALRLASGGNVRLLDTATGEFIDAETDYPDDDPYNIADINNMRDENGNLTFDPGPEPEPEPETDRHEATEQELEEPAVVGEEGSGLPPAPKPKRTRKTKPKAAPVTEQPDEPQTLEEAEELDGELFDAMQEEASVPALDYDPSRKSANLGSGIMNEWRAATTKLAGDCPDEFARNGKPDLPRMLTIAGNLGFEKVTKGNLDEIMTALRHFDKAATKEQRVPF